MITYNNNNQNKSNNKSTHRVQTPPRQLHCCPVLSEQMYKIKCPICWCCCGVIPGWLTVYRNKKWLSPNVKESAKPILDPTYPDQHQNVITSRGSPLDHVWSTSVNTFVSHSAHRPNESHNDRTNDHINSASLGGVIIIIMAWQRCCLSRYISANWHNNYQ